MSIPSVDILADALLGDGSVSVQSMVDALPFLVSFVTKDERYGLVNRAYENWFGIRREDIVGRTLLDFIGEDAYEKLGPWVRRALAGERIDFEQSGVAYRYGGTRDVRVTFVPQRDASGNVTGYVALLEDVTERRKLEAEHERLARQRTEVLESMTDAFLAVDRDWKIVLVNRRFEEVARYSRAEMVGKELWSFFADRLRADSPTAEAFRRCMAERSEQRVLHHDAATERWFDVRVSATDEGIAVVLRDVTKERLAEEALRKQSAFEQQLIGIVSHDLRNPLNVIALSTAVLGQDEAMGHLSARAVLRIRNATDRATRLVNDLLDFTRARLGGGLPVSRKPSDLANVVRSVVQEVEAAHPDRTIALRLRGNTTGEWDADRLAQVVQNLLGNAATHGEAGKPIIVTLDGSDAEVVLAVHNEGAPVPEERLPLLFEPFERTVSSDDARTRSVGLGLYIVAQVVGAHRGRVDVRSLAGEGTTFTVTLPRA